MKLYSDITFYHFYLYAKGYGFENGSCPIVYTLESTLIGSGADFVEHVRERYDK